MGAAASAAGSRCRWGRRCFLVEEPMTLSNAPTSPPGTWAPARRAAAAIAGPIQRILAIEAASGIVLLAATVAALVWANTWTASYEGLWHTPIGGHIGPWEGERP